MSRPVYGVLLAAVCTLSSSTAAFAHDNKEAVQNALKAKHDKVMFLKELDHLEYLKCLAVLPAGPAGVAAYLEELIVCIAKEAGGTVAKDTVYDVLFGRKSETVVGGKPVYVGIATYNHWTKEKYPSIKDGKVIWKTIKVKRPNTHQFYVAIGKK